ncbi:MAG: hypothetical protein B7Y07_07190 [Halothiobacillus sp. 24-54-40]|nr:MAG: hypothetical protein B7Y58_05475 [Halothiobacillus sp. 35-54-62]OYZ86691.1 MAG: hypothetical protein B7Y07_07190 [Halothiobacillus sp. 24-54-40]
MSRQCTSPAFLEYVPWINDGQKKAPDHSGQWFILEEPLTEIGGLAISSLIHSKKLIEVNKKRLRPAGGGHLRGDALFT